jgi:hypothetical protein
MKRTRELEETAWVLVAIFLTVLRLFSYLFWKHISREEPQASQFQEVLPVPQEHEQMNGNEWNALVFRLALPPAPALKSAR